MHLKEGKQPSPTQSWWNSLDGHCAFHALRLHPARGISETSCEASRNDWHPPCSKRCTFAWVCSLKSLAGVMKLSNVQWPSGEKVSNLVGWVATSGVVTLSHAWSWRRKDELLGFKSRVWVSWTEFICGKALKLNLMNEFFIETHFAMSFLVATKASTPNDSEAAWVKRRRVDVDLARGSVPSSHDSGTKKFAPEIKKASGKIDKVESQPQLEGCHCQTTQFIFQIHSYRPLVPANPRGQEATIWCTNFGNPAEAWKIAEQWVPRSPEACWLHCGNPSPPMIRLYQTSKLSLPIRKQKQLDTLAETWQSEQCDESFVAVSSEKCDINSVSSNHVRISLIRYSDHVKSNSRIEEPIFWNENLQIESFHLWSRGWFHAISPSWWYDCLGKYVQIKLVFLRGYSTWWLKADIPLDQLQDLQGRGCSPWCFHCGHMGGSLRPRGWQLWQSWPKGQVGI